MCWGSFFLEGVFLRLGVFLPEGFFLVSFFATGFLPSKSALEDFFALADFAGVFLEVFSPFESLSPSLSSSHQKRLNSKEGLIFMQFTLSPLIFQTS